MDVLFCMRLDIHPIFFFRSSMLHMLQARRTDLASVSRLAWPDTANGLHKHAADTSLVLATELSDPSRKPAQLRASLCNRHTCTGVQSLPRADASPLQMNLHTINATFADSRFFYFGYFCPTQKHQLEQNFSPFCPHYQHRPCDFRYSAVIRSRVDTGHLLV